MRLLPLLAALLALAALAPAPCPGHGHQDGLHERARTSSSPPARVASRCPTATTCTCGATATAPQSDAFQLPGPVLCVTQDQPVTVSLLNNLPGSDAPRLSFPGQSGVTSTGGAPGLLGPEVAPGGTITYSFTPQAAGHLPLREREQPAQAGAHGPLRRPGRAARERRRSSPTTTRRPSSTPTASTWC